MMLLRPAIAQEAINPDSGAPSGYAVKTPPLSTNWTTSLGENPWYQYPRPQMVRDKWMNLNGVWSWKNATGGTAELSKPSAGTFGEHISKLLAGGIFGLSHSSP